VHSEGAIYHSESADQRPSRVSASLNIDQRNSLVAPSQLRRFAAQAAPDIDHQQHQLRSSNKLALRRPVEPSQYVSLIFGQRCRQAGIHVSMGAKGSALDNAVAEAFFATLKKELTRRRAWPTRRELQSAVFAWIEGWYNRRRLHSTLGMRSPLDYENSTLSQHGASFAASRLRPSQRIIKEKAA
jgi:transposase InsO family protein